MVFKRVFVPMVVLGIMLAMGSMAFAQTPAINCTIASTAAATATTPSLPGPTARATSTGHTEPVAAGTDGTNSTVLAGPGATVRIPGGGTVRVTCTNTSSVAIPAAPAPPPAGFLSTTLAIAQISFGVVITNGTNFPGGAGALAIGSGAGIRISATSGALSNNVGFPDGADPISRTAGTVTVQFAVGASASKTATGGVRWGPGDSGSFDLAGVLVSLNGSGKTSVDAALFVGGGTGYQAASPNSANVIAAVMPGLKDPTVATTIPSTVSSTATGGPANFNLLNIGTKQNFTIRIEENYQDLFKSANKFNGGGVGIFPLSS